MKLYLLRHAEAADGTPDEGRPLTRKGMAQSRAIGAFLAARGVRFDAAFTSPLVRAVETADRVLQEVHGKKPRLKLEQTPKLLIDTPSRDFIAWVQGLPGGSKVLMVGHNPSLSEHLARLLGMTSAAPVIMPKGALAVVRMEGQLAVLKLYLTPRQTGLLEEPA